MTASPNRMTVPPPKWIGYLALAVGAAVAAVAVGIIPAPEKSFHAPRWVLLLCGLLFAAGGGLALTHDRPQARYVFAPLMMISLGTIALWVAFYGDAAQFHSNLPTSHETTVSAGRFAFGLGGAACWLLAVFISAREFLRRRRR